MHSKECINHLFLILTTVLRNIQSYNWKERIDIFLCNHRLFTKKYKIRKLKTPMVTSAIDCIEIFHINIFPKSSTSRHTNVQKDQYFISYNEYNCKSVHLNTESLQLSAKDTEVVPKKPHILVNSTRRGYFRRTR